MTLPPVLARRGHFRLESGYHTDIWLSLDALFVDPSTLAPLITDLAAALNPYAPGAIVGPLVGGAFLAHALAIELGCRFAFAERVSGPHEPGMFAARYQIPAAQLHALRGERVVVIDDAISAGSSVRATLTALQTSGVTIVAVGALLTLGDVGLAHFAAASIPVLALERRPLALWTDAECPLCRAGVPIETPT